MPDLSTWRWLFPKERHHCWALKDKLEALAPKDGAVLDLGCGDNSTCAYLRTATREVWGTDFQTHPTMQHPEWFRLLPSTGEIPFEDNSFDLVSAVWVLEHVQEPETFLNEIKRIIRPGGRFLGHSINSNHPITIARRLTNFLPHGLTQKVIAKLYGRAEHDTFPTCYRLNSKRQLRRAAERAGLDLINITRYADPGYYKFNRFVLHLGIMFDWLCERLLGCGKIYFTVEMQKPEEEHFTAGMRLAG